MQREDTGGEQSWGCRVLGSTCGFTWTVSSLLVVQQEDSMLLHQDSAVCQSWTSRKLVDGYMCAQLVEM